MTTCTLHQPVPRSVTGGGRSGTQALAAAEDSLRNDVVSTNSLGWRWNWMPNATVCCGAEQAEKESLISRSRCGTRQGRAEPDVDDQRRRADRGRPLAPPSQVAAQRLELAQGNV